MKITTLKDRIRLTAQTAAESQAIHAIHDLVFFAPSSPEQEAIANDHGCIRDGAHVFNYCSIPKAKTEEEALRLCASA